MLINTASQNPYLSQQTDRPAPVQPQQLIERPIPTNAQSEASQAQSDRNPNLATQQNKHNEKSKNGSGTELTEAEKKQVEELKARDKEVRAHEAAHKNAAGNLAKGGAQYTYQTGPDGNRYAVGGEVNIDTSKGRDPEETIRKAQKIRRAALAPAEPSSQDRAVAAQASRMEAEARQELNKEDTESENPENKFALIFSDAEKNERTPGKLLNESA